MPLLKDKIAELLVMKKYPSEISYSGNKELLKKTKISIVGSRKPTKYSRDMIQRLVMSLVKYDICIVSGGAMGIDAVAHSSAGASSTIAVLPTGINIKYPAVNKNLLTDIEKNGLLLSQFKDDFRATPWSFVVRNELVVALGDILVVGEAELDSGTMRSVEFALKMGKEIFVFPQRLGESGATNKLLEESKAKCIYNIDNFLSKFCDTSKISKSVKKDDFLEFCSTNPSYEEVLSKFPSRVFEAELSGEIIIKNGRVLTTL